jgi:hypothetical protein
MSVYHQMYERSLPTPSPTGHPTQVPTTAPVPTPGLPLACLSPPDVRSGALFVYQVCIQYSTCCWPSHRTCNFV